VRSRQLWTNGLVVQALAGAVDLLRMKLVWMVKFQPFVLAKHMFAGFSIVAFRRKGRLAYGVPRLASDKFLPPKCQY
jgi:hypothetical protein